MAIRTDAELVRKVLDGDEESDYSPYIVAASSIVDDVCVDTSTYTYTAAKLELIERWLAAHFFTVQDGQVTEEQAGPVREKVAFKIDLFLLNTKYGQVALALDTAGNLAAWQKELENGGPRRCGMTWLGSYVTTPAPS